MEIVPGAELRGLRNMVDRGLDIFRGKLLKIFLKQNIVYTGIITDLREDSFIIIDKFNHTVFITYDLLERIEVLE